MGRTRSSSRKSDTAIVVGRSPPPCRQYLGQLIAAFTRTFASPGDYYVSATCLGRKLKSSSSVSLRLKWRRSEGVAGAEGIGGGGSVALSRLSRLSPSLSLPTMQSVTSIFTLRQISGVWGLYIILASRSFLPSERPSSFISDASPPQGRFTGYSRRCKYNRAAAVPFDSKFRIAGIISLRLIRNSFFSTTA